MELNASLNSIELLKKERKKERGVRYIDKETYSIRTMNPVKNDQDTCDNFEVEEEAI